VPWTSGFDVGTLVRMASGLVGRADELGRVSDLVRGALDGRFGAVVVEGDAGIGKTSLVRAALDVAGEGALVLPGSCLPMRSVSVPLIGLRSAVRDLPPERRPEALAPARPGSGTAGPAPVPVPVGVDEWLARELDAHPVALVVDDLQWADAETLDVLMYVLAGPVERRLAVLLTVRSSSVGPDHPLRRWLADARRLPGVEEVVLEPLDRDEVGDLVEGLLGGAAHTSLVDEVFARSGGNPYFARLLVDGLDPASTALPEHLPEGLSAAAERTWEDLSPAARRLTLTLAVGGHPASGSSLGRVVDISDVAEPGVALGEAVQAGVLDVRDDGAYWFHHPVLAEVLHQRVAPEERRVLHAAFAEGYASDAAEGVDPELAEAVSDHHLLAGGSAAAYRWALDAAAAFAASGDVVGVLRMLRRAADLHPQVPGAGESMEQILEELRVAARDRGAWDEELSAVEGLLDVVDAAADPLRVAVLETWRAYLRFVLGHGQAVTDLERAVELSAGHPDAWQRVVVLSEYSRLLLWAGELDRGREAGLEALHIAEQAPPAAGAEADEWDRARAHAYAQRLMVATFANEQIDADGLAERAYAAAAPRRDGPSILHATFWHANQRATYGPDFVAAHERGRRVLEECGAPRRVLAWLSAGLSTVLYVIGDVEGALARLRVALGSDWSVTAAYMARLTAGMIAARQGRPSEAAAHMARAGELVPDPLSTPQFPGPTAMATVRLLGGDPEGALDIALAGMRIAVHPTLCEWLAPLAARALADLAQADVDAGRDPGPRRAQLVALREEFPKVLEDGDTGHPHYARLLEALDALYAAEAARAGVLDDPPSRWAQAAAMLGDAGLPWDEAYVCRRAGESLLAHGGADERRRAAAALRRGHDVATRLGARPDLDAIGSLARSARIRLDPVEPTADASGDGILTRREREVLAHVVAGRTYAEIADALFLSEKTVSSHISNILHKTGTSNRVELASWAGRVRQS
jgi:DNA-binding CsgD family transcriptional regulator/tetratricopeptide (TPR) repeat protein